ncbi:MAG: type VI secretion system tip protein VgrG, partial [Candidatus Sumerlaeaceae bacterium]|nr:type VI secretion system tip protein VgrG [Candidatus Sumerlaeaceae bacterium]
PRITPKPVVQGPQTAIVVGPKGEEIYTDQYGRVKCHFHWDRHDKSDENSSCWIRVSQTWAGKQWGAMHIPRIGQEVIVDFLEGDPDQPIITGRVYNGASMPPYGLPANKTISGVISRSSKDGGAANFNEIRFEDKKGEEQIVIHAEHNVDEYVENDFKGQIDGNKYLKIKKDQVEKIEGNLFFTVGKGGNSSGGHQDIVIEKDKKELIEGNSHLHVKSARKEKIDGDQSLTVGTNQQEKVGTKHALEAGQEIHLKAGMTVVIEAGLQLTIKGAGGFIDIGPAGVTIQGTLVNINSGGAAGSGSGSSPEAPEDATKADPQAPSLEFSGS